MKNCLLICFPLIIGEIEQLSIYILTVCISFNFFLVSLYVFLYIIHINSVTYMADFFSCLLFIFYLFYGVFFVLFLLDTGFKFSCSEVCYSFMASIFCDNNGLCFLLLFYFLFTIYIKRAFR